MTLALVHTAEAISQDAASLDECGGIRRWNVLGAYVTPSSLEPLQQGFEEVMRRDYMTDGNGIGELEFVWKPGATIMTDFGGAAASSGIKGGLAMRNPGMPPLPTVFAHEGETGFVDFQDTAVFGEDPDGTVLDDVMAYAQAYVMVEDDMEVFLGISSDDAIQVLLNGKEVWIHNTARAGRDACAPQDASRRVHLGCGQNSLLVKVFEQRSGWNFAVRFQDEFHEPVTEGLLLSLEPAASGPPRFLRGDADGDGAFRLSDAVSLLNFLFLGGGAPPCDDAADADDDGDLSLTDAVSLLEFLFLGGRRPPRPSRECGCDASGDLLDCAVAPLCTGL